MASRSLGRPAIKSPRDSRRSGPGRRVKTGYAMAARPTIPAKVKQRVSKGPRKKRTRPEPRQYTMTDLARAQDRVEAADRRVDATHTAPSRSRAGLLRAPRELHRVASALRCRRF